MNVETNRGLSCKQMMKTAVKSIIFVLICFNSLTAFSNEVDECKDAICAIRHAKSSDTFFFPRSEAVFNGYEVTNRDWRSFTESEKRKFVFEAVREVEYTRRLTVSSDVSPLDLVHALDTMANLITLGGEKKQMFDILFLYLKEGGYLGYGDRSVQTVEDVMKESTKDSSDLIPEHGKLYVGYIACFERNGVFLGDNCPPVIGDERKRIVYEKYARLRDGTVALYENYPLYLNYVIISIKEINRFLDKYGYDTHYYQIEFECVE